MEFAVRKRTRIPGYDYSTRNYYFITICTHEKKCIFGTPSILSGPGIIAKECIVRIPKHYPQVVVDKYVVMPNHIHMILILGIDKKEENLPDVTHIIGQYKMSVTKKIHEISEIGKVWQRSFHDHIIRNQQGYEKIWKYIESNPYKWEEDCFYQK